MELLIIIIGIFLDRITKMWALTSLSKITEIVVIKDFFSLVYLENRGAAFGILQNKLIFLSIVTLAAVVGIIYYLIKYKPNAKIMRISFALIIAGALGNLYDRIGYKFVVDFISLHYKNSYYYPIFNVADMMVVIGTVLLAFYTIKEGN